MRMQSGKSKFVYTTIILIVALIISFVSIKAALRYKGVLSSSYIETRYKRIPVLMYHSISLKSSNLFTVSPRNFEIQIKAIKDNGYTAISLDDLYNYLYGKENLPQKPIMITFDDGYEDNYINAYPVLKKYDCKAAFFIITSNVDKSNYYMKSEQIKKLSEEGFDIGSHTLHHDHLPDLDYNDQEKNLCNSKQILESIIGKKVDYISYPFGQYNENTIKAIKKCGYKMSFTVTTNNMNYEDIYTLHRNIISNYTNMNAFLKLSGLNKGI